MNFIKSKVNELFSRRKRPQNCRSNSNKKAFSIPWRSISGSGDLLDDNDDDPLETELKTFALEFVPDYPQLSQHPQTHPQTDFDNNIINPQSSSTSSGGVVEENSGNMPLVRQSTSLDETAPLRGPLRSSFSRSVPDEMIEEEDEDLTSQMFKSQMKKLRWAFIFGFMSLVIIGLFLLIVLLFRHSGQVVHVPVSPNPLTPREIDVNRLLSMAGQFSLPDVESRKNKELVIGIMHLVDMNPEEVDKVVPNEEEIRESLKNGQESLAERDTIEDKVWKNDTLPKTSPSYIHQKGFRNTSIEAQAQSRIGFKFDKASQYVAKLLNLTKDRAVEGIVSIIDGSLSKDCENFTVKVQCNETYPYRLINGTCNNLHKPLWGSINTPYRRILLPAYEDGISRPREYSTDGNTSLPNPRYISLFLHPDKDRPDPNKASLMLPQWGQFIDHDITGTAISTGANGSTILCCNHYHVLDLSHPECVPIFIDVEKDPFYKQFGRMCLNMVRDAPALTCKLGPREQFNQITTFIDGSNVYGSTLKETNYLRASGEGPGRLRASYASDGRELLPISTDPDDLCNLPEEIEQNRYCFKSGDARVNEQLGLTSMHTIWTRHHNQIADKLSNLNPKWDDEQVFQESRRIVGAHMQHITYNEFLPLVLGTNLTSTAKLFSKNEGFDMGYNSTLDPTIANVFAAAAYRFGHSMIQGLVKLIGPRGKNEDYLQLHKLFFNPFKIWNGQMMDAMIRGLVNTPAARVDTFFTTQLSERLFQFRNESFGFDLVAVNIQRGREHGLPGYTKWRSVCGLGEVKNFTDLDKIWDSETLEIAHKIYKFPDDIDLYTGGLAELPIPGGILGPTFACLIADQFFRLKYGDRFWYESRMPYNAFTSDQLDAIRSIKLSRIICDNSDDLNGLPMDVFTLPSVSNPIISCGDSQIPNLNLQAWKEIPVKFKISTPESNSKLNRRKLLKSPINSKEGHSSNENDDEFDPYKHIMSSEEQDNTHDRDSKEIPGTSLKRVKQFFKYSFKPKGKGNKNKNQTDQSTVNNSTLESYTIDPDQTTSSEKPFNFYPSSKAVFKKTREHGIIIEWKNTNQSNA